MTISAQESLGQQMLAAAYDEVPSPNLPMPSSSIEHLWTIARLRGLSTAEPGKARVLELGCASGQNLLPMAERNAGGQFLGIDFSPRQIEFARSSAREIGLENIDFRELNLAELPDDLGQFDYVIAHAVYSWVDDLTRDRLIAAIHKHLAPQGLAFVSYNCYPGWHVHDALRAIMLYDAQSGRSTAERLAYAKAAIAFLNDSLDPVKTYDAAVKAQLGAVLAQSDAYLLHDHLELVNHPVYFREFAAHAERHRLQVAGDCILGIRFNDYLSPEAEQRLEAITNDPILKEEYRDIVRNRSIRQTLVCHDTLELARGLRVESIEGMYLAGNLHPEKPELDVRSMALDSYVGANGLRITTSAPLIKAALAELAEAWPKYLPLAELLEGTKRRLRPDLENAEPPEAEIAAADLTRLHENLLQACAGGVLELHAAPAPFSATISQKPTGSPLARWQASRASLVTNRKHEVVRMGQFERHLLQLLEGSQDAEQLSDLLTKSASEGRFPVYENEQPVTGNEAIRRAIGAALPAALQGLARNAFLIA
jgi:methyltransferase-like protein/2-polyprenyl-3-methyl-5-hydroxy-6-metoxy-1,4-benzoquinol methylase